MGVAENGGITPERRWQKPAGHRDLVPKCFQCLQRLQPPRGPCQEHGGDRSDRDSGDQIGRKSIILIEPPRRAELVGAEGTASLQDQCRTRCRRHVDLHSRLVAMQRSICRSATDASGNHLAIRHLPKLRRATFHLYADERPRRIERDRFHARDDERVFLRLNAERQRPIDRARVADVDVDDDDGEFPEPRHALRRPRLRKCHGKSAGRNANPAETGALYWLSSGKSLGSRGPGSE